MKLNKTSLGFSLGIVWGLGLFLITLFFSPIAVAVATFGIGHTLGG